MRRRYSASVRDQQRSPRPRSLILYIYGGFARRLGGWLAVADLISLMADLGVEAPAVRSAVARMKEVGLLDADTRAGAPGYALTTEAWRILEEGDRRILAAREPADISQGWVLVAFSIPESRRDLRHQVRSRLIWLGFGTLVPGAWIAPRRARTEIEPALRRLGVDEYTEVLEVSYAGLDEARRLVRRSWDLDELGRMYARFTKRFEPLLDRWAKAADTDHREAFVDYIRLIAEWRKLPFLDPGLPPEVLPPRWQGDRAKWIHLALLERLDYRGLEYVRATCHGEGYGLR